MKPNSVGVTHPIPIVKKGRYFSLNEMILCANDVFAISAGLALMPSANDATIVKYVVN